MIQEAQGARPRRAGTAIWLALAVFVAGVALTVAALLHLGPRFGWTLGRTPAPAPVMAAPATPAEPRRATPVEMLSAREQLLAARLTELETRLAMVNSDAANAAGSASRAENLLVMLSTRRALDRGRPLDYLENQLRLRFGPVRADAVATIVDAGRQPVTLEDLRVGFAEVAPTLLAGPADESWWDGIRRELSQLVVIRQGTAPSTASADRIDRARRRLDGGQVEAAIAEVERLPGVTRAASWLDAANRYVAIRRALAELDQRAAELPAAPPPVPAQPFPLPIQPVAPDATAS